MPIVKEQIMVEKVRARRTVLDKMDILVAASNQIQFLQKGLQVARKSDSRKKKYVKLFLVDILIT